MFCQKMKKHLNIKITGKVQGVWYRGSTKRKAEALGLVGFVRNEPDGSVYAEVEGNENDLKTLVKWCKEGPPLAKVISVETEEAEMKNFTEFVVQR